MELPNVTYQGGSPSYVPSEGPQDGINLLNGQKEAFVPMTGWRSSPLTSWLADTPQTFVRFYVLERGILYLHTPEDV